ncbi:MAG TPA: FeoC-like transcriptional regulator [Treponemataceae bacterium]|nr:FeoC-like transcriptional regulator [Treponemataceae bacterium]
MLRELLSLLAGDGAFSPDEAAAKLGVSVATLDDMLARLVALGYAEDAAKAMACAAASGAKKTGGCAGCPMAGHCHGAGTKAWTITAKGREAAARG